MAHRSIKSLMSGKGIMGRVGVTGVGAGVGVASQIVGELLQSKTEFFKTKWWAEGAALAATSVVLQGFGVRAVGYGLGGAAGYSLALRYKVQQFVDGKRPTTPFYITPTGQKPSNQLPQTTTATSGIQDTAGIHMAGGGLFG
jgi:hypothetical protein